MIEPNDIAAKCQTLRLQLGVKMGVRGRDLEHALRKAGRRLPRRLRRQGAVLVAAEKQAGNPRLARQLDGTAEEAAYEAIAAHLRAIDVADVRKGRLLALAAVVGFNLLVVIAAFVVWLWWFEYV